MAQRDRSQGFGFVYVDIARLLTQKNNAPNGDVSDISVPVESSTPVPVINFNKDKNFSQSREAAATANGMEYTRDRVNAMNQIRENLDRLQSLHHKLHAMLGELNSLTGDKKKSE